MRPRSGDLLAGLVLILLVLVCFARLVARPDHLIVDGDRPSVDYNERDPRVVGNDLTSLFLPHNGYIADHLWRNGRLPLWDASGFAGRPMVGNPQGGLFYPPVWLVWASGSPAALGWLTVGHLVWAGLGTYVLARGLGIGRLAATIAAGCFEASPYLLAQTFEGHDPHVWAACWYPWAIWAFLRKRRGEWRGALALPVVLALMFLAGHPQEWYYLVVALSLWTLIDALRAVGAGQGRAAAGMLLSWGGLVALSLGLVAVELVPDLAAQGWALRSVRFGAGPVNRYHLHALSLWQLLDPAALGGPADYFGHDNYWESVLSIGLVPLVLVLVALACHRDRARVSGWLLLVVGTLVFACGRSLGLFTIITGVVPGMERFRVPSRSLFLFNLGAAVLAGLGVEALGRLSSSEERWRWLDRRVRLGAAVVLAGLVLVQGIAWFDPPHRPRREVRDEPVVFVRPSFRFEPSGPDRVKLATARVIQSGPFWLAIGGMVLLLSLGSQCTNGGRVAATWALGALALIELGLHGQALVQVAPASRFLGPDPISAALARAEPPLPGPIRIRARDPIYSDLNAWSNGFEKININDSFQVRHAADLYETLYPLLYVTPPSDPGDAMGEAVAWFRQDVRKGVLDRLGIVFLVSDHAEPGPDWPLIATGTCRGRLFTIHRNPSALPRAYVVPRAHQAIDDAATTLALFRRIDPKQAVLMPSDPLGSDDDPRQSFTIASYDSGDPDRVVVRVTTEAPGLLVIADTWMPGWSARVDGQSAPILRGNHAQRVIPLPRAGRHEIVMRYAPPGLTTGLGITGLSALAWLVLGQTAIRRATRRKRTTLLARIHKPADLVQFPSYAGWPGPSAAGPGGQGR